MKIQQSSNEHLDFEAWASLLIHRKVPDNYQHLINSEVVHDGAAILERGDAFEVRIADRAAHLEVLVTPFPPVTHVEVRHIAARAN
jgi:hypothetical protein